MVTTSRGSRDIRNLDRNIKERAYFTLGLWNWEWKTTSSKKESTTSKGNKEDLRKFSKRWKTRFIMLIKIYVSVWTQRKRTPWKSGPKKRKQFPADWNHWTVSFHSKSTQSDWLSRHTLAWKNELAGRHLLTKAHSRRHVNSRPCLLTIHF